MSKQEWVLLIGAVIVGVFAVICVVGLIIERKKLKGKEFDEEKFAEPEYDTTRAKVVDIKCDMHYEGVKMPKLIKEFVVFFEVENREIIKLDVLEEYYSAFEVGQEGLLTLVNGNFISFDADGESEC